MEMGRMSKRQQPEVLYEKQPSPFMYFILQWFIPSWSIPSWSTPSWSTPIWSTPSSSTVENYIVPIWSTFNKKMF